MKIVHIEDVELTKRVSGGRAGTWESRRMMRGDAEHAGNFSLTIYYHNGTFYSPRHHHNFDQFRYQLDGIADFDINGKMEPETLGYFPEGAYYGPTSGPAHTVAVLQFGGPSGSGFMGARRGAAAREMEELGRFEKGVFHRKPGVDGMAKQDSYEAVWEYVNKRRIEYPKPIYAAPILIRSDVVPWIDRPGCVGVQEKRLGIFTHCGIRTARYRLEKGARLAMVERGIYMILEGEGQAGKVSLLKHSCLYLEDGEDVAFSTNSSMEVLQLGMPSLQEIEGLAQSPGQRQAV